jgi:hypothetical protein
MIKIKNLDDIFNHRDYIKKCCNDVKDVYFASIYFKDRANDSSGVYISYGGYPSPLEMKVQCRILAAINAACNTDFVFV